MMTDRTLRAGLTAQRGVIDHVPVAETGECHCCTSVDTMPVLDSMQPLHRHGWDTRDNITVYLRAGAVRIKYL
ncbi:hypothetical protein SAMN05421752_11386 [Natronorubrum thiooxidans]|uniref:Uncharacterized protein n=1 Tax=Natronorubrum thiooxidans TaxID=308853 RepID=A0A1N7GM98_9EURY|nr:hypothetical protein SAMN05421752_11386 [Natronorubrum thiooxidans]